MSPTDAMLTRMDDVSGSGSGGGGGGGAGSTGATSTGWGAGSGTGSGAVVQAASSASAIKTKGVVALVTEADSENVDLRGAQTGAQHVQFVEVFRRTDIHTMVVPVVNFHSLDVRLDAMQA